MSDDGFLTRWSRRKVEAQRGVVTPQTVEVPVSAPVPTPALPQGGREGPAPAQALEERPPEAGHPEEPPPPTMADAAALPAGADIRQFMTSRVDEDVKRVALKKLFADPHFNVMDGLDTYIDDYSKPDPIPMSMLRKMAQAQFLGLFDEEPVAAQGHGATAKASPDGAAAPAVPQSANDSPAVPIDEDPDLRLQQDDAAGPGGAGEGPAA